MNSFQTRLVSFAGSSVTIAYTGAQAARTVEFLFQAVPVCPNGAAPHITYRLDDRGALRLLCEDQTLYQGHSAASLAERLLGEVCHQLVDRSRGGLLFHAAAVAHGSCGLILPGATGAGKTTLTAWLLAQGFSYLTDELVFVPTGAETIESFPRPLNLKRTARQVLTPYLNFPEPSAQILSSETADLVPPALLNPTPGPGNPTLACIVFPRYRPDAQFSLQRLTKAQAGKALMECLVNARNLPEYGFVEINRLTRGVSAYRMEYANFDQIGRQFETLMSKRRPNLCTKN